MSEETNEESAKDKVRSLIERLSSVIDNIEEFAKAERELRVADWRRGIEIREERHAAEMASLRRSSEESENHRRHVERIYREGFAEIARAIKRSGK